jgi:hypothetical protein
MGNIVQARHFADELACCVGQTGFKELERMNMCIVQFFHSDETYNPCTIVSLLKRCYRPLLEPIEEAQIPFA